MNLRYRSAHLLSVISIALCLGVFTNWALKQYQVPSPTEYNNADLTEEIQAWSGHIIVLNFWATWCPPCRDEIPHLVRLQTHYHNQGVQVIGVALDRPEMVDEFISGFKINYPCLIVTDYGYRLLESYGSKFGALPYTVIINRDGEIVHRHHDGILDFDTLVQIIEPLLQHKTGGHFQSTPGQHNHLDNLETSGLR